jgi:lipoprotein-anchoring transpeptidase ErfK/SrfK
MRIFNVVSLLVFAVYFSACEVPPPNPNQTAANTSVNTNVNAATPTASPAASPVTNNNAQNAPITLPVLDAMFVDEAFAGELKQKLSLTDEQVNQLRTVSGEAVGNLDESNQEGSTQAANKRAEEQIRGVIGEEKTRQLEQFVNQRWQGGDPNQPNATNTAANTQPNSVPTDTRIVVNAPAYRMDVFNNGQLVKTYKVGIGYPEFPLPTGNRQAKEIIFNPTWTPPDEPWVKGKIQPGKKVEAGSKLNPLGPIKIPIGLPSLIHGGKQPARLGTFASHGCVGLTDAQVKEFAVQLASISGTSITQQQVDEYGKNKTETKNVKLAQAIPVELRYDTIVVEDGKLIIYRDVYEKGTNTEENLRSVLQAHGVSLDTLSEEERNRILEGLKQMARDPQGNPVEPNANANVNAGNVNTNKANANNSNQNVKETKTIKGAKDVTIELAALAGKGYPAPKDLSGGTPTKGKKS